MVGMAVLITVISTAAMKVDTSIAPMMMRWRRGAAPWGPASWEADWPACIVLMGLNEAQVAPAATLAAAGAGMVGAHLRIVAGAHAVVGLA